MSETHQQNSDHFDFCVQGPAQGGQLQAGPHWVGPPRTVATSTSVCKGWHKAASCRQPAGRSTERPPPTHQPHWSLCAGGGTWQPAAAGSLSGTQSQGEAPQRPSAMSSDSLYKGHTLQPAAAGSLWAGRPAHSHSIMTPHHYILCAEVGTGRLGAVLQHISYVS